MSGGKSDFYWAAIHRHRGWLWFDNSERRMIDNADGKIDHTAVQRIGVEYSVIRGFQSPEKMTDAERVSRNTRIAQFLATHVAGWPDGLIQRHGHCLKMAEKAIAVGLTEKLQISAMTKFMWFLRPTGWTVFDAVAATGLQVGGGGRESRSLRFYRKLESVGFEELVDQISRALRGTVLDGMHPERVVDSFLYLRGITTREAELARLTAYPTAFPEKFVSDLVEAAEAIASAADPFLSKFETP